MTMAISISQTESGPSYPREPSVTIIITTRNNQDTIFQCVKSLLNLNYPKSKLRVVVADASDDDSTERALEGSDVRIIRFKGNAPSAYNFALREVDSDLVGFVDGDAVADPDWLSKIVRAIENPNIVGGGGPIRTWNKQNIIPRCVGYELEARYNSPKRVVRSSTTNLVLKRGAIAEVGGFDEALDTGYDGDIGFRLAKRGYKILFVPNAIVYHSHRSTLRSYLKQQYVYARNDVRLYHKNSGLIRRDNVTTKWMVIQPPILLLFGALSMVTLFISWLRLPIIATQVHVMILSSVVIGTVLLLFYILASARLTLRVREPTAFPVLLCIFGTRAIAWTIGGIAGLVSNRGKSRRES